MTLLAPVAVIPALITTRPVDGTTCVVLAGSSGPEQAAPTERTLLRAGETAPRALVVDLVGVTDLHHGGAAALERVLADLQARPGATPVVTRDHRVVDALVHSGVAAHHPVVASRSAAPAVPGGHQELLG